MPIDLQLYSSEFEFNYAVIDKYRYLVLISMLELKNRVEKKISKIKRVEDELFLLIFSTRSFNL